MTPFLEISMALSDVRGIGRSFQLLDGAPRGATILALDANHRETLRGQAYRIGRRDLKIIVPVDASSFANREGPFLADHHAVEGWLAEAGAEISRLKEELAQARMMKVRSAFDEEMVETQAA